MKVLLRLLGFIGLLSMQACLPVSSTAGSCQSASLYGKWKKIEGYPVERSDEVLRLSFNLLVIERGKNACESIFVNSAQELDSRFQAEYLHDIEAKSINITYKRVRNDQTDLSLNQSVEAAYSFGCSGKRPTMTLDYSGGLQEVYELWSSTVNSGDCPPIQ